MSFRVIEWYDGEDPDICEDIFDKLEEAREYSAGETQDGEIVNSQLSEALLEEEDVLEIIGMYHKELEGSYEVSPFDEKFAKQIVDQYMNGRFKKKYES
jgi:CheY-specific phosphatase CheX